MNKYRRLMLWWSELWYSDPFTIYGVGILTGALFISSIQEFNQGKVNQGLLLAACTLLTGTVGSGMVAKLDRLNQINPEDTNGN